MDIFADGVDQDQTVQNVIRELISQVQKSNDNMQLGLEKCRIYLFDSKRVIADLSRS